MPININTYCRINRNGSFNINTDPTFPEPINFDNFACAVVGGDEPGELGGTYVVTGTSTVDGVTRSIYTNIDGFGSTIQLTSAIGGPVWAFLNPTYGTFPSTSQPAPDFPWLATGYGFDLISLSRGPC